MTNEQTAVLLYNISRRLRDLARRVRAVTADDEWETEDVWIGEGREPLRIPANSTALNDPANWEERRVRPVAVGLVEELAEEIQLQAELLLGDVRELPE